MTQPRIILIGGGNMGGAMALRWHAANAGSVAVVERDASRRAYFAAQGIACVETLADTSRGDIYVLAIKPQQFDAFRPELVSTKIPLLVSIMAGVTLAQLHGVCAQAVRVMPNLPASIGESMSVLCALALADETRGKLDALFSAIGSTAWVADEQQLHAVTAISGSGPAYVFAFMEALEKAAIAQGLSAALAKQLVAQTFRGAALLAAQSPLDVSELRAQVTSKGGTTHAALEALSAGDFEALIVAAVQAASARSKALAASSDR